MFFLSLKAIRFSSLLLLVVFLAFAGAGLATVHFARQAQWWVSHSQSVQNEAKNLLVSMLDAETSEQGYLLTGDKTYLAPYDKALMSVQESLGRLRILTADNPSQISLLGRLEDLTETNRQTLRTAVDSYRVGQKNPMISREVMDEFRLDEKKFEEEEVDLFLFRTATLNARYAFIVLFFYVLIGTAAGSTLIAEVRLEKIWARMMASDDEGRRLGGEIDLRYKERITELEAFSYSISHDLRAPLRAINGYCRILLDNYAPRLDVEGKRLLDVVANNALKMARLIDDILRFSRISIVKLEPQEVNMTVLANEVVAELTPSWAGRDVKMAVGSLPVAHGDAAMLRQVWINLLSNALTFTRPKASAVISLGAYVEGAETIYYVKDNGVGFDMRYVDKLFVLFQHLHSLEEFGGTGAGLAIVKAIITRHGGRVWAEGKVNEGATIYFALPTGAEKKTA